jgi:hypothetical protein
MKRALFAGIIRVSTRLSTGVEDMTSVIRWTPEEAADSGFGSHDVLADCGKRRRRRSSILPARPAPVPFEAKTT